MPTEIWSIEDLDDIRNNTSGSVIIGDYVLMRDLDFTDDDSYDTPANKSSYISGSGWTPIGQTGNPWFGGNFDGQGFVIKNMMIADGTTGQANAGLFGIVDDCIIENIGVINPRINVEATNNVTQVGALIAGIDPVGTVVVRNCWAVGGLIGGDDDVGGLIGVAHEYSTTNLTVENCYSTVNTTERGSFQDGFGHGGLIGAFTSISAGGSLVVDDCYAAGHIRVGATTNCGGLIGFDATSLSVTNSFWDTEATGFATSAGGTGRTTTQMRDISTFSGAGWNIATIGAHTTEIWVIDDDVDYPRLALEIVVKNEPPSVILDTPDARPFYTGNPGLDFTGNDPDNDDITYQLQIDDGLFGAWDVANAVFNGVAKPVSSQDSNPLGIFFKPDGLRMYMVGGNSDSAYQYDLLVAWDMSTAIYNGNSVSVASQGEFPQGIFFSSDGTKMYVLSGVDDAIYEYALSSAWDVTSATYNSASLDISGQVGVFGTDLVFSSDGSKLFMITNSGADTDAAYQYSLTTAWDLSTASYDSVSFSVASQTSSGSSGLAFSSDGTKMFVVDATSDAVYQYTLSAAWDLSTASYSGTSFSTSSQMTVPESVRFSSDGSKMYVLDGNVFEYDLEDALLSVLSDSGSGFTNKDDGGDTDPFTSQDQIEYAVQASLMAGSHSWRVRGKDPAGSRRFGEWSAVNDFSVNGSSGSFFALLK